MPTNTVERTTTATRTDGAMRRIRHHGSRTGAPISAHTMLRLMWLASPALPVGGFSYSEGIEAAVEAGLVGSEDATRRWLLDHLHLGLARSDIAVVAKAFTAWWRNDLPEIIELNAWTTSTRETAEFRQQTGQMGRSMADWLKNQGESVDARVDQLKSLTPAPTWPIAFALAAAQTGAPLRESLLSFTLGWAENMVQAALKAVPLGQAAGQRVLAGLIDEIPTAIDRAAGLMESERQAFTPMLAILSSQHEVQYSRLFRS